MIAPLIELAARRTTLADAALKTDETTSLRFAGGRVASAAVSRSQGVNLRVVAEGRMGFAGTTDDDAPALLESALRAARQGEAASVALPRPAAKPPAVQTHGARVATENLSELTARGTLVRDRLSPEHADLGILVDWVRVRPR